MTFSCFTYAQNLYGCNFLILSWVAFSYGWHFHGALHMQYIIELVRKNCSQGGRESDVHPEIAAFTSVDSVTAKLTPLCLVLTPFIFSSLDDMFSIHKTFWTRGLHDWRSCCMIMQDMRTLASVCF